MCGGRKFEMVQWCEICDKAKEECAMASTHLRTDAKGMAVRQEILFGKFEEQRRVDVLMGREAGEFRWKNEVIMESARRCARRGGRRRWRR